jgi:hypothetical protein
VTSRPSLTRLMRMVKQAEAAGQVIEVGELGATSYVVTDPIDRFTSLVDYLEANPPTTPKARPADPAFAPGAPAIGLQAQPPARSVPPPAVEVPKPAGTIFETWPAPPPGSVRADSGTRIPVVEPIAAPRPTPPLPPPVVPPPPPPPSTPLLADSLSGEATNLFGPPSDVPPPAEPPGGYAWPVRRADSAPPAAPPPYAGSMRPVSDVSEIFGSAPAPPSAPPSGYPPPGYPPPAGPPGDYAQMPGFPPPPPSAAPPAAGSAMSTRVILILAGAAIGTILAALAAYWYFFMHKG